MKRTGDWPRKAPLRARTGIRRSTPLSASKPSRVSSVAGVGTSTRRKRAKVTAEERAGRKALAERSGGRCEIGGTCPAREAHHRKNRSQGGTWAVENLLHLCSAHHLHVTTHPAAARQQGWAVLSTDDPSRMPVWLAGRGWSFLTPDGGVTPTERSAA